VRHARLLDLERGIGYLSIHSFSRTTTAEFEQAFDELRESGMRSLVLDLRGNFGGVLSSAIDIAARFIPDGTLVSTEGQGPPEVYIADPKIATLKGFPLVVLVDGNSASASEVLAAALQDHRAGVVVGAPTYGKGLVQSIRRFPGRKTIAKVTSSYYYTPSHQNLERTLDEGRDYGILPDVEVALERAERNAIYGFLGGYSPPTRALTALLEWQAETEGEVIPRPPADAQLEAATALLQGNRPGPTRLSSEIDRDA
ncbi:MAG: S41 family peptidase, partial [Planctomycetota bacterium]